MPKQWNLDRLRAERQREPKQKRDSFRFLWTPLTADQIALLVCLALLIFGFMWGWEQANAENHDYLARYPSSTNIPNDPLTGGICGAVAVLLVAGIGLAMLATMLTGQSSGIWTLIIVLLLGERFLNKKK